MWIYIVHIMNNYYSMHENNKDSNYKSKEN